MFLIFLFKNNKNLNQNLYILFHEIFNAIKHMRKRENALKRAETVLKLMLYKSKINLSLFFLIFFAPYLKFQY